MLRDVLRCLGIVLSLVFSVTTAAAQATGADVLFDQGRDLMQAGKCDLAIAKFAESNRLDPAPGTLLNLAECYAKVGKTASAWTTYRDASSLAATLQQKKREKFAQERARELEPKLARLAIQVPDAARVAGLAITRAGVPVPEALWGQSVPVDPGSVEVRATAPGHSEWTTTVQAVAERSIAVSVQPLTATANEPAPGPAPVVAPNPTPRPPPQPPPDAREPRQDGSTQRTVGYVVGAAGLLGLGIGALMYADAEATIDDANCPGEVCVTGVGDKATHDEGCRKETRSGVVLGLSTAVLLTGASLVLFAPTSPSATEARLVVSPLSRSGALTLRGHF